MIVDGFLVATIEVKGSLSFIEVDTNQYEYDEEFDTVTSLFCDLSYSFYERQFLFFLRINDCELRTHAAELSIFLEEFINLLRFTTSRDIKNYELVFFEQGASYSLLFKRVNDNEFLLKLNDKLISNIEVEETYQSIMDLNLVLATFYCKLNFVVKNICPSIFQNDMYKNWKQEVEKYFLINENKIQLEEMIAPDNRFRKIKK